MPETINERKVFSLIEVTTSIQKTISERYKSVFWVKAEMNKLNYYSHSGHCYPELVEKTDGKVIAQMKANLWKTDFDRINHNFLRVLKEPLKDGINMLFCASVIFDPSHGLSLRILDIDPSFSLGELEREKQDTLERLRKEGLFNLNKVLKLPVLPQRIAIISVETSKGYSDFLNVIENNPWGYKFFRLLFPSLLQGEKSVPSIINQLKRIKKIQKHFDVVAIIRGGGGDVGLSSYNNYALAKEIALFPIPVLTGIGHSTNETVAEMVSHRNAITPTELADFLIQRFHDFSMPLRRNEEIIVDRARRLLNDEKLRFKNFMKYFRSVTNGKLLRSRIEIKGLSDSVLRQSKFLIKRNGQLLNSSVSDIKKTAIVFLEEGNTQLQNTIEKTHSVPANYLKTKMDEVQRLEKNVQILDPINILKRGFSITLSNGKALKSHTDVKPGDTITSVLANGRLESNVRTSDKSQPYE
ncbi:MAG TPA: exodeoxyribonuclease VII large subunit [Chryseolinea sp.]|nr:exodeoxyribonuclease VII large subunit [Chryseolinea sp.]